MPPNSLHLNPLAANLLSVSVDTPDIYMNKTLQSLDFCDQLHFVWHMLSRFNNNIASNSISFYT